MRENMKIDIFKYIRENQMTTVTHELTARPGFGYLQREQCCRLNIV